MRGECLDEIQYIYRTEGENYVTVLNTFKKKLE